MPEIEALYDRPQGRSKAALQWLAQLMGQARTCGLTIQFSFEPPGKTVDDGLAASLAILGSYPQIQTLEMITSENGGHPEKTLARYLEIADRLRQRLRSSCPQLAVGIYETGPGLREGLAFLRQNCPPDIAWTFLPAHGARAVVDAVRSAESTAEDWRRTMVHSWVEFDGLMYLQQNSLLGTRQLLDLARSSLTNSQVPAIAFNHWRTAENRTAIRCAAPACLDARLDPESFYRNLVNTASCPLRCWVLADGKKRLDRTELAAGADPVPIDIELASHAQFLTIAVTEGADQMLHNDWVVRGDPIIDLVCEPRRVSLPR